MKKNVYEFVELMKTLRAPGGCPWDREQTHESIKMNMLEEAYETCDAIEEGNDEKTMDELGDVLMQVVFHAIIAEEEGKYDLDDIAGNVFDKMVRRHPHVFGENDEKTLDKSSEVLVKWEKIKSVEKGFTSYAQDLKDVVKSLPALTRAEKIQKRAGKAGFDWENAGAVIPKIKEEIGEVEDAMAGNGNVEEEIGDLLFAVANLARKLSIDPEKALMDANRKFVSRFEKMEKLYDGGEDFASLDMKVKDELWEKAKKL